MKYIRKFNDNSINPAISKKISQLAREFRGETLDERVLQLLNW